MTYISSLIIGPEMSLCMITISANHMRHSPITPNGQKCMCGVGSGHMPYGFFSHTCGVGILVVMVDGKVGLPNHNLSMDYHHDC